MKCPECGLINPDNAKICDCGYRFFTDENNSVDKDKKVISLQENLLNTNLAILKSVNTLKIIAIIYFIFFIISVILSFLN